MKHVEIEIGTVLRHLPINGAASVLVGIDVSPKVRTAVYSTWLSHANGNFGQAVKAVSAVLESHEWNWPWFEMCLTLFSKYRIWPENVLGWDAFEPKEKEPQPTTPDDALPWLNLKEVRDILKSEGIKPRSQKRADIYNALYNQVSFDKWQDLALSNWHKSTTDEPDLSSQASAKIVLLVLTLSIADYLNHRARQVGEIKGEFPRATRVTIKPKDKAAQFMMREASDKFPQPGIPPFYPGDRSELHIVITRNPSGVRD